MSKAESEAAIRVLCHEWRRMKDLSEVPTDQLHFSEFLGWLMAAHPQLLKFRSAVSPEHDVELWFDSEFGQIWRR
jgi:hypothetical protein